MITVEIRASNLDFFEQYELEERLAYSDFHEVSKNMQEGEFVEFTLYDEESQPFYKGKFNKDHFSTVTEDIFSVLKKYEKEKKLTKKDRKQLENKLSVLINDGKEREEKPKKTKKKIAFTKTIPIKKIGIVFAIIFSLIFVGVGVNYAVQQTKESKPSMETLLKEQKFNEAVDVYPNKINYVENQLFEYVQQNGRKQLDKLKEFQKNYPTKYGQFDLYMFDYDYSEGISIYEANKKLFTKDDVRLLLVGYAYLKVNKLSKAEEIQKEIENPELEKYIRQYRQYQQIIDEKEKEIKELQKKPTENKQKILKAIDELYEAKQSLTEI